MSLKCYKKESSFPPIQETALRVYSMRFCPYAQRTLLVLEHKNIPYEVVNIDLRSKPDWFLERNPVGTVPVIEKGGKVLYESTATSEWIDDVYPCPRLAASDPFTKAEDRMLLEYFSKITTIFYTSLRKPEDRDNAISMLNKHYHHYEKFLARREGPFFGGASPSLLDFFIWPHLERIAIFAADDSRVGVNETDFPALSNWYKNMYEVPAVKKLQHPVEHHKGFFKSFLTDRPDYDYGL